MDWTVYRDGNVEKQIGAKFPITRWTVGVEVEQYAEAQLYNVANMPFIDSRGIVVLPDCHAGKGSTIGSVIPTKDAVIVSAVGVDIGCGADWELTTLKRSMLPKDLATVRKVLEEVIPHGFEKNNDPGSWKNPPVEVQIAWEELEPGYKKIISKHPKITHKNPINQLGTLGGGNHVVEIVFDELDRVGILIHSGSRGPGNKIGQYFIDVAKLEMKRWHIDLYDMNLAYLPAGTGLFEDYMFAVKWAQRYAQVNRELMRTLGLKALKKSKLVPKFEREVKIVSCHHNYVTKENHFNRNILITRKGAISARKGEMGIILGSMGTPSHIVQGLGCKDSFQSASHGAGRKMSRTEAKKAFTLKAHREATAHVECRKDAGILDETPGAYKPIEDVMNAQKDLVESIHTLQQVVCIKG